MNRRRIDRENNGSVPGADGMYTETSGFTFWIRDESTFEPPASDSQELDVHLVGGRIRTDEASE